MAELRKKPVQTMAERILYARKTILKLNQEQFSNRLGVSQSNVSRWENGTLKPESEYLMRLSSLLHGHVESLYFLEAAGVPEGFLDGDPAYERGSLPSAIWSLKAAEARKNFLYVPLLRDAAAAGTPLQVDESQIETMLAVHKNFASPGSSLVAIRVTGGSMSPTLEDGFVVFLDTAQADPKKLRGQMVAARDGGAVTVSWLREVKGRYWLVPQHTSPRFDIQELVYEDGWAIVGVIIHWIGFPPPLRK